MPTPLPTMGNTMKAVPFITCLAVVCLTSLQVTEQYRRTDTKSRDASKSANDTRYRPHYRILTNRRLGYPQGTPRNVSGSLYLCWGVLGDDMEQYSIWGLRAAGMREMSMAIIEEEEDTAYHVLFDDSGPGSVTRYASHQYKHIDMRSKCGTHREHTYQRRTGPENLVVNRSERSKNDRAIKMTQIERTKDTQTRATLPLIAIDEAVRMSLLPV